MKWNNLPNAKATDAKPTEERWETVKQYRYIVHGHAQDTFGGYWGAGDSLEAAEVEYKKAGGKRKNIVGREQFVSSLLFAPSDRDAADAEADCWIGQDGGLYWIRCERVTL